MTPDDIIQRVETLNLGETDVLFLLTDKRLTVDDMDRLNRAFRPLLARGILIAALCDGMQVKALSMQDAERLGWKRGDDDAT